MKIEGLNRLAQELHAKSQEKGFWDKKREIGTLLMLVVSELSEALEADRKDRYAKLEEFETKLKTSRVINNDPTYKGLITPQMAYKAHFEACIKDRFEDEIADTFIRLFDLCGYLNLDIEKHIQFKMQYNESREYKHGKKY